MKVNEIFYSIQGESSFAGWPCIFVRLTGCNLRCSYCDTRYAYEEGEELDVENVLTRVAGYDCRLVEITGGEPLVQEETPLLIRRLLDKGYRVLLETNGSRDISVVDERCHRIVDIKLPGSGEAQSHYRGNLARLRKNDELKCVVGDRLDYEYAKEMMGLIPQKIVQQIVINISPLFSMLEPRLLAEWILEDRLAVRLNLQLHKIIWPSDMRGV